MMFGQVGSVALALSEAGASAIFIGGGIRLRLLSLVTSLDLTGLLLLIFGLGSGGCLLIIEVLTSLLDTGDGRVGVGSNYLLDFFLLFLGLSIIGSNIISDFLDGSRLISIL